MVAIVLQDFKGEQPRIPPRYLAPSAGQSSINTRLDNGALSPLRKSTRISTVAADVRKGWQTLVRHDGDWLGWDNVVHAVPGPVAQDRLYYTGDNAPKMRYDGTVYDLKMPRPSSALTPALGGSGSGDVITRLYTYTWVSDFGEESEPALASAGLDWQPGNTVTLSGFDAVPTGRNITKQRIYRSQTGQLGTFFYLIDERAATNANYVDTVAVDAFQEVLPSTDYNQPPDTMEGLIALPNGMMAAFNGRDILFCEPYQPHAWPEKYRLRADYEIMGLVSLADAVIVVTRGQPYLVRGSTPESMQMIEIEQDLPCINKRSIVDLGYSAAYASHEGLVIVDASGAFRLATAELYSRQDWNALNPALMVGVQWAGRYVAFYDRLTQQGIIERGGLLIQPGGQSFLDRTADFASAAWYDLTQSALYYVDASTGYIMRFDAGDRDMAYWKSKVFVFPHPVNFAAAMVESEMTLTDAEKQAIADARAAAIAINQPMIDDGIETGAINEQEVNVYPVNGDGLVIVPSGDVPDVTMTIYADEVFFASVTDPNDVVRLPGGRTARKWEIEISTDAQIDRVAMATTVDELKVLA
jgi:hypothetical protein